MYINQRQTTKNIELTSDVPTYARLTASYTQKIIIPRLPVIIIKLPTSVRIEELAIYNIIVLEIREFYN